METLGTCSGCGGVVVDEAETCPMCAAPGSSRRLVYGLVAIAVVIAMLELLSIF